MKHFLARITPPCKDITHLLSHSMDRTLPFLTRLQVRVHMLICEGCRRYRDQLDALRHALRHTSLQADGQETPQPSPPLSSETRVQIKRALDQRRR